MENLSQTPIADVAERQLELRKQFINDYCNHLTTSFTDKIKSSFEVAIQELELMHVNFIQQTQKMLQQQDFLTIKTEEPTEQTGIEKYGN